MRVLLLNQFFHPDLSATAQLACDLAEDLVAAGHEVTAIATRGSYLGGGGLPGSEVWRGVRIDRVPCTSLGKTTLWRRALDYGTFLISAFVRLMGGPRPDVVIAMSTPPLVAAVAGIAGQLRGLPFVYWLQDVYPELAVKFGVVPSRGAAVRAFEAIECWTLRNASSVVVLGERMRERIVSKGVARSRVALVPNWADGKVIYPVSEERNGFRRANDLVGRQVVLYSGNMGRAHDLETILAVARSMRDDPGVLFLFIGDGHLRGQVAASASQYKNVRLLPYQARDSLAESLSAGDVHVVSQRVETLGLLEPSKLYGVLAVGRPVLVIGPAESEVARTVVLEGVGECVAPGDVECAQKSIQRLLAWPSERRKRIRRVFEARYDRSRRTAELARILSAAAGKDASP